MKVNNYRSSEFMLIYCIERFYACLKSKAAKLVQKKIKVFGRVKLIM